MIKSVNNCKNWLKLSAVLVMAEARIFELINARTISPVDQAMPIFAMTEGQPCA